MISVELLSVQNPWWVNGVQVLESDSHLLALKNQPLVYDFQFGLKSGIHVCRGPRQVGKTTWLKTLIQEQLHKTSHPLSVFFYSCDLIQKPGELADVLNAYYQQADAKGIKMHFIFLDEVTSILQWGNALKYIANTRNISSDVFVITGSSAVDLRKGAERLPGRGIEGNEFEFAPLSFREYAGLVGKKLPPVISLNSFLGKQGVSKSILSELSDFFLDIQSMNNLLVDYLKTGGFLRAINDFKKNDVVAAIDFEIYARWLESDISKADRNSAFAKQTISALLSMGVSQFSFNSIAKKTSLQTHVSAGEYVQLFEDMMLVQVVHKLDLSKKMPAYRKEKKVCFRDPFIAEVLKKWSGFGLEIKDEVLLEHIVLEHLFRWAGKSNVFFYNDGRREVDAVVLQGKDIIPVEIKWQSSIQASDFAGLYSFGRGILLTKNRFEIHKDRYLLIPLALFLLVLDIKPFIKVKLV